MGRSDEPNDEPGLEVEVAPIDPSDPKTFFPGLVLRYIPSDWFRTIASRKDDDTGWWFDDESGLADAVFIATQQWEVAAAVPLEDDAEISSIGFDHEAIGPADIPDMVQLMHDSNESRVAALEQAAGPGQQGSLENAFDALRMLVFIEQIAFKLEISDICNLDFEGRRAKMLTSIEQKYQMMKAARDEAERQARIVGGPPPGQGPRPMRPI